jgi:hypothetical protein
MTSNQSATTGSFGLQRLGGLLGWWLLMCFVVGCDPASPRQQAINQFVSDDDHKRYTQLVTQEAEGLKGAPNNSEPPLAFMAFRYQGGFATMGWLPI